MMDTTNGDMTDYSPVFLKSKTDASQDLKNCLYHSKEYRFKYQALLNMFRKNIVKEKYVRTLGARICLCKDSGDYLGKLINTEMINSDTSCNPFSGNRGGTGRCAIANEGVQGGAP